MMTAGLEPAPAASSKGTGTLPPFVTPRGGNGSGGGGDYPTRLRAALRVREQSIRGHDGGEHEEEGEEGDFLARWPRLTRQQGGAVGPRSSSGGKAAEDLSSAAAAGHGRNNSHDDEEHKSQDLTAVKARAGVRRGAMPVAPTKGAPPLELLQPSPPRPQHDGRQQEQESNNEKEFLLPRNVFALADELYLDVLDDEGAQQARERKQDLEIIHMSASEVVRAIVGASDEKEGLGGAGAKRRSSSRLTSERALRAVARRAVHAQQLTNCLTDFFYSRALARARQLDAHLAAGHPPIGPLHGLPVSIKEHFTLVGRRTGGSWLAWAQDVVGEEVGNGKIVRALEDAGAVLYCKTTEPQSVMQLETHSFLGRTLNPFDTDATSGGSSGGESSLVSLYGSFLGIGTDIGGSVRAPAAYTGLSTLKPTAYRLPISGVRSTMGGSEGVAPTIGPMARSLEDVELLMSAIIGGRPWKREPGLLPLAWRGEQVLDELRERITSGGKIRLGYFIDDGVVTPHPPVRRAMQESLAAIEASGWFDLVPFEPLRHGPGVELVHALYFPDGGKRLRDLAAESGEPILPLTEWAITRPRVKDQGVHGTWALAYERNVFRETYAAHWQKAGIDALLCPPTATTAPKHGETQYWGYTAIWNLLDYPATTFPASSRVDAKLDQPDPSFKAKSETDAEIQIKFDPEAEAGHPVGLQVVAYRCEDEMAMAVSRLIVEVLQKGAK